MMLAGPLAWAAAATGLVGTVLNAHYRNRVCFILWFFSNVAWLIGALIDGAWPLAAQMAIYTCISVDGWFRWKKMEQEGDAA